jgi:hypothetical protein
VNIHVNDPLPETEHGDQLFALALKVQPDIARTCVLASLEACVARTLLIGDPKVDPRGLIKFFPRESAKILDSARLLRREHRHTEFEKRFKLFFAALDKAKAKTIHFAASGFAIPENSNKTIANLTDDWVACCGAGHALLTEIHCLLKLHPMTATAILNTHLNSTLQKIMTGDTPLISSNGTIEMPLWAERRASERIQIKCPALLIRDTGATEKVMATNISNEGVGLQTRAPLAVNDRVIIRMSVDKILSGVVTWSLNGRAAVRFSYPIDATQISAGYRI